MHDTTSNINLKPLRVLIIEDSETDAFFILRQLRKGGYDPIWERVETEESTRHQLATQQWDVIISDYTMPGFSGLAALSILKETKLDIPFILVSGAIGEETAVAAMKAGAGDYLLKGQLTRLVPAIERELKESESRRLRRLAEQARRKLEHELQQAKELAELANQRKSRVLAFVAHEFKNPLKAIETFANILQTGYESGKPIDDPLTLVQGIQTACQHIRELMDDILDIAPIEAGQIELNYKIVELESLLDEVRIILEELAKKRGIILQIEMTEGVSLLRVDPKRLRQILINVLSNAIKYTYEQDVVLLKIQSVEGWVEFVVQDHGPGIPEDELQNLFMDFYRVQNTLSNQKEGLGLGLALVKKLVELHGGNIQVDSALGQGTRFVLRMPILMAEQVDSPGETLSLP
jgi:signal transduction histidine kinase